MAARLSFLGFHAVPTTRNVRGADLLVSTLDGEATLSIQVKTTMTAMRTRGRGSEKKPDHYEWDIVWSSARQNHEKLLFALVDLRSFEEMPDIFLLPSNVIFKYFEGGDPETWTRARYHPIIDAIKCYKNNWETISTALLGASAACAAPRGADFPRGGPAGNVPGFNILTGGGHAATRIILVYHLYELAVRN